MLLVMGTGFAKDDVLQKLTHVDVTLSGLQSWFLFPYARETADLRGSKVESPYALGDARFR
jgi:hypothetical protein